MEFQSDARPSLSALENGVNGTFPNPSTCLVGPHPLALASTGSWRGKGARDASSTPFSSSSAAARADFSSASSEGGAEDDAMDAAALDDIVAMREEREREEREEKGGVRG